MIKPLPEVRIDQVDTEARLEVAAYLRVTPITFVPLRREE